MTDREQTQREALEVERERIFDELRQAAHVELTGIMGDGKRLRRSWNRPAQSLIDYIAALEERVKP